MTDLGRTIAFVTMGCAKNEVDSEHMAARLVASGYEVIDDPERADAVIVNTCSFIQAATEESIDAILEVAGYESVASGEAHLVVSGCMPSRYGEELEAEIPEAGSFVPCADEKSIVSIVDGLFGIERMPGENAAIELDTSVFGQKVSAYVKISDGCDRFCAYCTIPFIRGRYHSFTLEDIKADVQKNVDAGVREIVLIAQDTGRWGTDFEEPSTLARLLDELAVAFPSTWFRVMYIQPEGITDELVDTVAKHENICSYFDIPFQHSNARILKSMNRRGSAEEHLTLLDHIRERVNDVTLRTTLIVGYPGESEDDFDELCEFVEEAELDYVGVFAYSREEGTRAYNLDGQVEEEDKAYRLQTIRDLADTVSSTKIATRTGKVMEVLVCGFEEDGQVYGRAMCQAPDVDGVTYIEGGELGDIVKVRIDDTLLYEMEGSVIA